MAKIAFFSDLHAHPFRPYATILPNGMNSRLNDAIQCIEQIIQICARENVDLVAFGGDLFHERRSLNVVAFNAVYEALAKFRVYRIPVVMIHGNHDQADREGNDHSLHTFRTFCTVFDKPEWKVVKAKNGESIAFLGIPYTENKEHLRQVVQTPSPDKRLTSIQLGHLGIQGARVGADFVYSNPHDAAVSDLNSDAFDSVFLGHYHIHQKIGRNVRYIGAPLQHTWGDKNQDRGFLIYDTSRKTVARHWLHAPKFVEESYTLLKVSGLQDPEWEGNYVRIIDSKIWSEDERESARSCMGAKSLEIIPPKVDRTVQGPRLMVDPGKELKSVLKEYVSAGIQPSEGLEKDYLMQIGLDILDEVEQ